MRSRTRRIASLHPISGAAPSACRLAWTGTRWAPARSTSIRIAATCDAASIICVAQSSIVRGASNTASSRARRSPAPSGIAMQMTFGGGGSIVSSRITTERACRAARSSSSKRWRAPRGSRISEAPDVSDARSAATSGRRPSGGMNGFDPNGGSLLNIRPPPAAEGRSVTKGGATREIDESALISSAILQFAIVCGREG